MYNAFIRPVRPGTLALLAATAAATAMAVPAAASTQQPATQQPTGQHAPTRVYVSVQGTARARDAGCGSAAFATIGAALSAVASGGEVVVCGGTYREGVTVSRPVALLGESHATISAAGHVNGVLITAAHVVVSGFTVTGATGEGILARSVRNVTIERNVVAGDDLGGIPGSGVTTTYRACLPQGGVPGDCGEGIHLMGTSFATVADNVVTDNTGGIQLSDETGPASHDDVIGNLVTGNLYDCGVTVVGHNPAAAPSGVPAPKIAGVYDNVITGNDISGNGMKGAGSGVVLATGLPGGAVYDNIVERNTISGNGQSGVTLHSHVPGQFLGGNIVEDNLITVNNLLGDNDFAPPNDDQTTGILVATAAPLTIKISGNEIVGNHFGIWTTGPVTASVSGNVFDADAVPVGRG
jgi:parallel beta-helix repeat protein